MASHLEAEVEVEWVYLQLINRHRKSDSKLLKGSSPVNVSLMLVVESGG